MVATTVSQGPQQILQMELHITFTTHCSKNNTCCSNECQSWFYRDLGSSTTDDIEARICISYKTYAAGGVVVARLTGIAYSV